MNSVFSQTCDTYRFGASHKLTPQHLRQLVNLFNAPDLSASSVLGGRRSISRAQLEGIGAVVVKHYRRGGLLAHLIKKTYVKRGKPRCQLEFEQMEIIRKLGVQAPEPVAYAYRGNLFYRAWLMTKEIKHQQSLAQLSITAPERIETAMKTLVSQIAILIDHGILHADFHPGNVLVNNHDQVFLIDFDKAGSYRGSRKRLRKKYFRRWNRAVDKHRLPTLLGEMMQSHL